MIERRNSNDIVVFQTNKSGKMSVDTKENYIMASATHFQDKEIELKEARTVETEINAHAVFWIRMLQAGKSNNDEDDILNIFLLPSSSKDVMNVLSRARPTSFIEFQFDHGSVNLPIDFEKEI